VTDQTFLVMSKAWVVDPGYTLMHTHMCTHRTSAAKYKAFCSKPSLDCIASSKDNLIWRENCWGPDPNLPAWIWGIQDYILYGVHVLQLWKANCYI